jgi:hypothetical protein
MGTKPSNKECENEQNNNTLGAIIALEAIVAVFSNLGNSV